MAQILVRDLDPQVKERLRRLAAEHGRSMEAEARAILTETVMPSGRSIVEALREAAIGQGGVDLDLPDRSASPRETSFD